MLFFTAAHSKYVWRYLLSSSIEVVPRPHHIALWEVNTFHELKATVHHNPTCSKYLHAPTVPPPSPSPWNILGLGGSKVTINLACCGWEFQMGHFGSAYFKYLTKSRISDPDPSIFSLWIRDESWTIFKTGILSIFLWNSVMEHYLL